jgi:hypothetical protein
MQRGLFTLVMLIPISALGAANGSFELGAGPSEVVAVSQAIDRTAIDFRLSNLEYTQVTSNGQELLEIALPAEFAMSRGAFLGPDGAVISTVTRLIAVPFDSDPSLAVTRSNFTELNNIHLAPASEEDLASLTPNEPGLILRANRDLVTGEIAGVMRDLRLYAVTISPVQYDPETATLRVFTEIEIEISHSGTQVTQYGQISEAFSPVYRSFVDNPAVFDPVRITRGAYWVIYPDVFLDQIQPLVEWKKAKGFNVVTINKTEIGSNTYTNIKNYILARFDSSVIKPDYIVILGDVSMPSSYGIATREYTNPYGFGDIGSDNFYTFLYGNDYFPDVLIGRISFDYQSDLNYYLDKFDDYERHPYMDETTWYHRGVVVAGSDGFTFTSPRFTKLWCREAMMNRGFTYVDTFFAENGGWELPALITEAINNGVSFVNYRGYGAPDYWTPPYYANSDLNALSNANKYGIMTSMVCGTGDYNDAVDVCFGETWIRGNNKGGVGFIGNSNHDAHTRFTNTMDIGIYWGWFVEDATTLAQGLLMGKMALYNAFPTDRSANGQVELYFNSYNNLGDPEINCWTDIPRPMTAVFADSIQIGQNRIDVNIRDAQGSPIEGAAVCVWKGSEVFSVGFTDANGDCRLASAPATAGYMRVTTTARNFIPVEDSLNYFQGTVTVGYASHVVDDDSDGESLGDADGVINPSERIELPVILANSGVTDTAFGVSAELTCQTPGITISRSLATYGDIAPGQSAASSQPFFLRVAPEMTHGITVAMILDVSDTQGHTWQNIIELPLAAGLMEVVADTIIDGGNQQIDPGEIVGLVVAARNSGGDPLLSAGAILRTADPDVQILDSTSTLGNCLEGDTVSNGLEPFQVAVGSHIYIGHTINFTIEYTGIGPHVATASFGVPVGTVSSDDPLGPDNYGYYCFDDTDTSYANHPTYQWIDINIAWTYASLSDDDVETIDLPFPVQYYGQIFDEVSICDNGFVALGRTWWPNFYNGPIPAPQNAPAMLAPFWDDFTMTPGRVYYHHAPDSGMFIMGWRNAYDGDNSRNQTFEIIILDNALWPTRTGDNDIIFQYQTAQSVSTMSAGICSPDRRDGLQLNFNNIRPPAMPIITNGRAVKFTTGSAPCRYIPGDVNNVPPANGIDVTYGVAYFKGGSVPPVSCPMCPLPQPFYAALDVNGSCTTNGIDVTYFVGYLKGGPALRFCSTCPPGGGSPGSILNLR